MICTQYPPGPERFYSDVTRPPRFERNPPLPLHANRCPRWPNQVARVPIIAPGRFSMQGVLPSFCRGTLLSDLFGAKTAWRCGYLSLRSNLAIAETPRPQYQAGVLGVL